MVKYYEESLDRVFFALADNKRRHILRELCQGYRTAKELAEPFKISLPAVIKTGSARPESLFLSASGKLSIGHRVD